MNETVSGRNTYDMVMELINLDIQYNQDKTTPEGIDLEGLFIKYLKLVKNVERKRTTAK